MLVTYPDSHPVEPQGFSEKRLRVALSKASPSQARGQSQVIKEIMTKSLGSMGWETGYTPIEVLDRVYLPKNFITVSCKEVFIMVDFDFGYSFVYLVWNLPEVLVYMYLG